jgi:hypothetical protein
MLKPDGTAKIVDFGLARRLVDDAPSENGGTIGYLAPEQARGAPVDARADLFAFGVIASELCTGRRLLDGATRAERLSQLLGPEPLPLDEAALQSLAPVVARCLEKDPKARFQSAEDLAWVLEHTPAEVAAGRSPVPLRRRAVLVGAGAGLAGLAGYGWGWHRAARRPFEFRPLTYRQGRVAGARFTRDGSEIWYGALWDEALLPSVFAQRLSGGGPRRVDMPEGDVLAVSAERAAVSLGRRMQRGQSALGRLALVPLEGGAPRVLLDEVQDADFSPDGRELAVVVRSSRGFRLEYPMGKVLFETARWLTHPRVSPDGALVACLVHPSVEDDRGDVVVVERATGRVRTLAAGFSSANGTAWSADGRQLWFSAAEAGADNAVRTVTLAGKASLVVQTAGRLRLHDVDGRGRALVSRDSWRMRLMMGQLGEGVVDRSRSEFSLVAGFPSEGEVLVSELGDLEPECGVYLVPVNGGTPLRLGPGVALGGSPSGKRVAVALQSPQGLEVSLSSRESGRAPRLDVTPVDQVSWGAMVDDEQLVLGGSAGGASPRLWLARLGGQGAQPLTSEGDFGVGAIDSAARRVAFVDASGRLQWLSLTAPQQRRVVHASLLGHEVVAFRGGGILVRSTLPPLTISRVDAETGQREELFEISPPRVGFRAVDAVAVSPDGKRYAYSYGQELSQLFLAAEGDERGG